MNVAILDQLEGKRTDAIKRYQLIIERAYSIQDYEVGILGNVNMANAYFYNSDYSKAETTCLNALQLSEEYNDDRNLAIIYKLLSFIYEKKGDASKVLEYSKLYQKRNAEIFNIEKEKEVNRLQIKFDSKEKDHQISQLERQQMKDDLLAKEKELSTRKTLFWIYLSVIILILSLVFILIVYARTRNFSRRQNQLLEEREILLKEVHHRVKNNLQIVSSLLNLQGELSDNLNPQEVLIQSQNRIQSIAIIHEKLYQSSSLANVKLDAYIQELIHYLRDSYDLNAKGIEIRSSVDSISIDLDQIVPCGLIINELITNSIKHAFVNEGTITINGIAKDGEITLDIIDNGNGFPENFELSKSNSLGLKLAKGLTRQLKGSLEIIEGSGAHFRLIIKQ
jgi:two-component sensor histidine kinase